jgi:hypothetical protein
MESAMQQVASASVAAIFSVSMLFAAHVFSEYRSSRTQTFTAIQLPSAALSVRPQALFEAGIRDPLSGNWRDGGF